MQNNAPNGEKLLLSLKFFAVLLAIITIADCIILAAATLFYYHCCGIHFSSILAFVDFPCRSKLAGSNDHDIFPVDSRLLFFFSDNGCLHPQRYRSKHGTTA